MHILELSKAEKRKGFETFLAQSGADLVAPTSQWELLRFTTARGVGIVYTNSKSRITLVGEAEPAFEAYRSQQSWSAGHKTPRKNNRPHGVIRRLLDRDGAACFLCLAETTPDDRTVDHMIPLAHGGPNNIHNYTLTHRKCNADAGHKTLIEKIRIREANLLARGNAEDALVSLVEVPFTGHCGAARDGECGKSWCPQLCDGEPAKSGRSCPLPDHEEG